MELRIVLSAVMILSCSGSPQVPRRNYDSRSPGLTSVLTTQLNRASPQSIQSRYHVHDVIPFIVMAKEGNVNPRSRTYSAGVYAARRQQLRGGQTVDNNDVQVSSAGVRTYKDEHEDDVIDPIHHAPNEPIHFHRVDEDKIPHFDVYEYDDESDPNFRIFNYFKTQHSETQI